VTSAPAPRAARLALIVMCGGAVAVVLAAATFRAFELDRFFIPKELVLHLTAVTAVLLLLTDRRSLSLNRSDTFFAAFLALSALSAVLASNHWLAARSLALSTSLFAIYWSARALAEASIARTLVAWVATAIVIAAVTSLLQAYGVESDIFSTNRSPGGTFGNRNFVAHLAAIGVPILVWFALTSRRAIGVTLALLGLILVVAALVLSRSRAAWIAAASAVVVGGVMAWRSHTLAWNREIAFRSALLAAATGLAVSAALVLPNTLEWKSDSPYLDSVTHVMSYREGSGRGRLIQYRNTMGIAVDYPLLGVGPGNWPVYYPRFAARDDPSLDPDDGMTSNPWPSSDWMAVIAERGFPAALCLAVAVLGLLVVSAHRVRTAADSAEGLTALAFVSTLTATLVCGAFDAVMLLPAPALLVGALLGALSTPSRARLTIELSPARRRLLSAAIAVLGTLAVGRSALQVVAMALAGDSATARALEVATSLDPGSYRIQLRLARDYVDRGSCDRAKPHALAARARFPEAAEPRRLLAACGVRARGRP